MKMDRMDIAGVGKIRSVDDFKCLGSIIDKSGICKKKDVEECIRQTRAAIRALNGVL